MPVDIKELTEGWLELESDPGLFTLLLEDFGVKGVQVEEIYDLNKSLDSPVYGFIFLFRWMEERRSRRKVVEQTEVFVKDEEIVNNIFFAQQMVPNSCATHALISILLNCPNIHLGETLSRLKAHTQGMAPDNKGWAIGNTPELACAHNSHAMPQAKRRLDKGSGVSTGRFTGEAFHFVSFVPINGRLFELDGLKPFPIDHGPWTEFGDWTEKFRSVMSDRLGIAAGEQCDIRFNLMAVVPDRRLAITHKLKMLKTNRQIVLDALQHLMKIKHSETKVEKDSVEEKAKKEVASKEAQGEEVKTGLMEIVASYEDTTKEQNGPAISCDLASTSTSVVITSTSESGVTVSISESKPVEEIKQENDPKIKDKVMLCPLDYSTPLTIQTSPAPSTSSTETSSEVGSAFNSPTQAWNWAAAAQNSPLSKDYKRFVVIRVANEEREKESDNTSKNVSNTNGKRLSTENHIGGQKKTLLNTGHARVKTSDGDTVVAEKKSPELLEPHTFAPQDLLALLRNLENEICICEINLKDENDKQTKYQVDDCRRTHNYDDFICTFLSMLAEQGKLADLVEQHLLVPKRPGTIPAPKATKTKKENKRKRGRSKVKRRK